MRYICERLCICKSSRQNKQSLLVFNDEKHSICFSQEEFIRFDGDGVGVLDIIVVVMFELNISTVQCETIKISSLFFYSAKRYTIASQMMLVFADHMRRIAMLVSLSNFPIVVVLKSNCNKHSCPWRTNRWKLMSSSSEATNRNDNNTEEVPRQRAHAGSHSKVIFHGG